MLTTARNHSSLHVDDMLAGSYHVSKSDNGLPCTCIWTISSGSGTCTLNKNLDYKISLILFYCRDKRMFVIIIWHNMLFIIPRFPWMVGLLFSAATGTFFLCGRL